MFAEIFLLRLEISMRNADEAGPVAVPRFVPLQRGMKLQFNKKLSV